MRSSRALLLGVTVPLIAIAALMAGAIGTSAYGSATNWQVGFAATGVAPGTGLGFGFWGWCAFGGGVTSGNSGDCQVSQYVHSPSGRLNCEQAINLTSWTGSGGTFVFLAGTSTTHPARATAGCPLIGGVPSTIDTPFDTGIPAAAGHYNLGTFGGLRGEIQAQVTQIR
jgi:hypothetical protein